MWGAIKLSNIHDIVLIFENGGFVVVDIKVIRSTKDCHDTWESRSPGLSVHPIPGILGLVCSNDG